MGTLAARVDRRVRPHVRRRSGGSPGAVSRAGLAAPRLRPFATSLGAPFWFDVLKRIMVIRSTVKPKEKTQEEIVRDQPASLPAPPAPAPAAPLHAHEWAHGDPKEGVI